MPNRRQFLATACTAAAATALRAWAAQSPVKIAHRQGEMQKVSTPGVYELAAGIPGISGVEVTTTRGNLWERENVLAYKKESHRWGIRTISMSGSIPNNESITNPGPAEASLRKTIQSGEILGANVVMVPGFRQTCPKMDDEASYGPTVALLQRLAPVAEDAGLTLGLELSLTTDEYVKLLKLVGHRAVRAYWDATGTESMNHNGEGIKGLEVLGADICQMHLKNGNKLLEEPGLVDWTKAFPIIKQSGYEGWFAFETQHATPERVVPDTIRNIAYVRKFLGN